MSALTKIRTRAEGGLSPVSQVVGRLFRYRSRPRFAGVSLHAPDRVSAWGIAAQIAEGEYARPGYVPEPGWLVVDIGANVGVYSLWAALKGATVVSYEPGVDTFDCLKVNTESRQITVHHAAVVGQTESGTVDLFVHDDRSTRNTLLGHEIGSGDPLATKVAVPAIPIADVLAVPCDLLKIDCEGAEFEIFAAATDEQLRRAKRVVLEFHRTAGQPSVLLERLAAAGFSASILEGEEESASFGLIGATQR